jgi:hypothetical protein
MKVNAPSYAKDFSHDFDINYHVKVNAPSCAKDLSHVFPHKFSCESQTL